MAFMNSLINDFDNIRLKDGHNKAVKINQRQNHFKQYKCPSCKREWKSAAMEPNQQCRSCVQKVQPERQPPAKIPKIPGNKTLEELKEERLFGFYRCPKCKKEWRSASAWVNHSQKCQICLRRVYPYRLKERTKKEEEDEEIANTKPHKQDLCSKCQQLGHLCLDNISLRRNRF